jgi:ABC-type uncharacterized transport system involved in gliding motility auxiliary subunit
MTADQVPNSTQPEQEPFIPPYFLLILAGIGFLVAILVLLTQASFNVVGWGGLGLGLLSLFIWGLMAPDQARAILTGRTARYGGTTIVVTLIFIAALVAVYAFVKGRSIRWDLTQRDNFSLNDQNRQAMAGLAVEPNVPKIKILAFYGAQQAGQRDQDQVLFEDYATTSQGKISYEFIDPDRNPGLAQQFNITAGGRIVVVPLDASDQPVVDKAQTVNFLAQEQLSNAILRVAASGDFRAYFLTVDDGLDFDGTGDTGLSELNNVLKDSFNWKTQALSFLDLANPASTVKLNDAAADGEVLVIAGGSKTLTDEQLKYLTDYLDNGGRLVIFSAPLTADGAPVLATSENLNQYLDDKFGLRFANNVVLDPQQQFQNEFNPIVGDFDATSFVTTNVNSFARAGQGVVFSLPRSVEIAPALPQNVVVTELAKTSDQSFARTDPAVLTSTEIVQPAETDPKGPFVVMASAENTATGARVVLVGSQYVPINGYAANTPNHLLGRDSLIWATKFEEFFAKIPVLDVQQRPEDRPIFVDAQVGRNINFLTLILLPFGVLFIGLWVWWNNRERAR